VRQPNAAAPPCDLGGPDIELEVQIVEIKKPSAPILPEISAQIWQPEPPPTVCTTWMTFAVVSAPAPPALAIRNAELPVALPPLTTSLSGEEPSMPRNVLGPLIPLASFEFADD
jgi:hypothetical protein